MGWTQGVATCAVAPKKSVPWSSYEASPVPTIQPTTVAPLTWPPVRDLTATKNVQYLYGVHRSSDLLQFLQLTLPSFNDPPTYPTTLIYGLDNGTNMPVRAISSLSWVKLLLYSIIAIMPIIPLNQLNIAHLQVRHINYYVNIWCLY